MTSVTEFEFSRIVDISELEDESIELDFTADKTELEALATRFDLIDLGGLSGHAVIKRITGGKGVSATVTFTADVVQRCCVTLKPVPERVEDGFTVRFLPADEMPVDDEREIMVDSKVEEEPPALLEGDSLELGELVAEYLSLSMEPYPRHPDAPESADQEVFAVGKRGGEGALEENPFAVLRKLKQ